MGINPDFLIGEMKCLRKKKGLSEYPQLVSPRSDSEFLSYLHENVYRSKIPLEDLARTWKSRKKLISHVGKRQVASQYPDILLNKDLESKFLDFIAGLEYSFLEEKCGTGTDCQVVIGNVPFSVHWNGDFVLRSGDWRTLSETYQPIFISNMESALGKSLCNVIVKSWVTDGPGFIQDGLENWIRSNPSKNRVQTKIQECLNDNRVRIRSWIMELRVDMMKTFIGNHMSDFTVDEMENVLLTAIMDRVHDR